MVSMVIKANLSDYSMSEEKKSDNFHNCLLIVMKKTSILFSVTFPCFTLLYITVIVILKIKILVPVIFI